MTYDYGTRDRYEIVWASGHVEVIEAHQVSHSGGSVFQPGPEVVQFHGMFDGHWRLVLRVLASDLRSVRNATQTEEVDRG